MSDTISAYQNDSARDKKKKLDQVIEKGAAPNYRPEIAQSQSAQLQVGQARQEEKKKAEQAKSGNAQVGQFQLGNLVDALSTSAKDAMAEQKKEKEAAAKGGQAQKQGADQQSVQDQQGKQEQAQGQEANAKPGEKQAGNKEEKSAAEETKTAAQETKEKSAKDEKQSEKKKHDEKKAEAKKDEKSHAEADAKAKKDEAESEQVKKKDDQGHDQKVTEAAHAEEALAEENKKDDQLEVNVQSNAPMGAADFEAKVAAEHGVSPVDLGSLMSPAGQTTSMSAFDEYVAQHPDPKIHEQIGQVSSRTDNLSREVVSVEESMRALAQVLQTIPNLAGAMRGEGAANAQGNGPANAQGNGPANAQGNGPVNAQGNGQAQGQEQESAASPFAAFIASVEGMSGGVPQSSPLPSASAVAALASDAPTRAEVESFIQLPNSSGAGPTGSRIDSLFASVSHLLSPAGEGPAAPVGELLPSPAMLDHVRGQRSRISTMQGRLGSAQGLLNGLRNQVTGKEAQEVDSQLQIAGDILADLAAANDELAAIESDISNRLNDFKSKYQGYFDHQSQGTEDGSSVSSGVDATLVATLTQAAQELLGASGSAKSEVQRAANAHASEVTAIEGQQRAKKAAESVVDQVVGAFSASEAARQARVSGVVARIASLANLPLNAAIDEAIALRSLLIGEANELDQEVASASSDAETGIQGILDRTQQV